MRKLLIIFTLTLSAACQADEAEPVTPENKEVEPLSEEPSVSLTYDGEEINTKDIKSCFINDCSEESAYVDEINHEEFSDGVEPFQVEEEGQINVEVEGEEPSQVGYSVQYEHGGSTTSEDHTLEGGEIPVHGARDEKFFLTVNWNDDNGEFQGAVSKAFQVTAE
ncbi:hypothetical protein [Halobacillus sp. A5]|uniref:hypothetical protein n=1 Tax=Halobacillus sp. A5 TaxID=2880263 RepID=UPI0020A6DAF6|nr:hypothetical protein [Halobacillus sp. A5]MCP3028506.1 hypothetical protein [Halobacillus sp. A5]